MTTVEDEGGTEQKEPSQAKSGWKIGAILSIAGGLYSYVSGRRSASDVASEGGGGGGGNGGAGPPTSSESDGYREESDPAAEKDPLTILAERLRSGNDEDRLLALLDTVDMLLVLAVSGGPFLAGWTMHRQFARAVAEAHTGVRPSVVELDLAEVGLSGQQLAVKVEGLARALEDLSEHGGQRRYGRALRWAKTILGSLAEILPGVHVLKELIETLENTGRDLEELEREFGR